MSRLNFWLDGVAASDVGISLQREVTFEAAQRNTESVRILGKNGAHVYSDGSYQNVRGVAQCFALRADVAEVMGRISAWLMAEDGYRRLETSEDAGSFRLARIVASPRLEPRVGLLAPFEVEFDCKPQRFLKYGDYPVRFAENGSLINVGWSLINPTGFGTKPMIAVTGSGAGTLTIGRTTITLSECDGVVIDSEERDVMRHGEDANSLMSGAWPVLGAGTSPVSFSGGIVAVDITPRWWTL